MWHSLFIKAKLPIIVQELLSDNTHIGCFVAPCISNEGSEVKEEDCVLSSDEGERKEEDSRSSDEAAICVHCKKNVSVELHNILVDLGWQTLKEEGKENNKICFALHRKATIFFVVTLVEER